MRHAVSPLAFVAITISPDVDTLALLEIAQESALISVATWEFLDAITVPYAISVFGLGARAVRIGRDAATVRHAVAEFGFEARAVDADHQTAPLAFAVQEVAFHSDQ